MRRLLTTAAAAALLALPATAIAPLPAQAQIFPGVVVNDPAAIAQMVSQVSNSLRQIEQLQAQLTNQVAMLQKLGTDVTQPLAQISQQATQLLQQAQAIGYNGQNIGQQFQQLYPSSLSGNSLQQILQRYGSWQDNSRLTLQDSMAVQNQLVRSQPTTANAVTSAVAASQSAAGQTAAIQATNQLLAALSGQLQGLQTILIAQARTQETILAQQQAGSVAAAAVTQRATTFQKKGSQLPNISDFK
ncbi:P-type conjugative transfer protein TrbJ [Phenylobacterium sp. SCN 70-31]|mgnify:CR=1 FL=1|uniref:P-type conjugative transfer protein TrbJ n=1 Tax=Phenylobacterium sp. SCN 70-31 TaxID=1660129 RepID=UPI00086DA94A|nr:P-type conjugative transfer protein TrbJ [Phenylobacterium sp. SCN 70-31]ODT84943.1 MAG: P-type conjugative transfer protein TrbJ [Phenylobacterium sp. SCN 70-31]